MNNDLIKEFAEQAGLDLKEVRSDGSQTLYAFENFELERFAELVRDDEANGMRETYMKMIHGAIADEREACAKLCDDLDRKWNQSGVRECAAAIRGRTE
jgi:hypothetical protein